MVRTGDEKIGQATEQSYRNRWNWDGVAWGSHCVDCFPGNCPYRVYSQNDRVVWEESAGTIPAIYDDIPDRNPMGCQKGAGWSKTLYGEDRVTDPLKRAGERGEGKWEKVSWDQALTEIADALLDAIQSAGPDSIIHEATPAEGGTTAQWPCSRLITGMLGGLMTDVNGVINDFQQGQYLTWGKFNPSISPESRFRGELSLIWHSNPAYTSIPNYHFRTEARYKGKEEILIGPDCSPSHVHADKYVPIKIGTDGALALAMCQVIISDGTIDAAFVKDQTDLPLLVRRDTRRFLRGGDMEEGGLDDQLYFLDSVTGRVAKAPRETLALGDIDPALGGTARVRLKSGDEVEVEPVFAILKRMLDDEYTPERAGEICGVNPKVIVQIARKVAVRLTTIGRGMNLCKYYHGDLMERAMLLLLALTGNWGRTGTGMGSWSPPHFPGPGIFSNKQKAGLEEGYRVVQAQQDALAPLMAQDPSLTREMAAIEGAHLLASSGMSGMIPITHLFYHHFGYRENWNNREWGDPTMARSFDEYFNEAMEKGWWRGVDRPGPETPPQVLIEVGGNMLRRVRGGQNMLLKHLWPKLKMIIQVDWRINTTGMWADYILPAAQHYEKMSFHFAEPMLHRLTFSDRAVSPYGNARPEWEIFSMLAQKVEERAKARGLKSYKDAVGREHSLEDLHYRYTLGLEKEDDLIEEWMRDTALTGVVDDGTDLQQLRREGVANLKDSGEDEWFPYTLNQASDVDVEERPFQALRWHVDDKLPYPTFTRRAQFYIDHEWFLEGGEELPVHKPNPTMGGKYPFELTSGHNRWSIHSMNITNRTLLETHRGQPHMVINKDDAGAKGVRDDDEVRVFNDLGEFLVRVKVAPWVRPGQVIVYNGWDPYQFRGWRGPMDLEPGMVKWLHLAGGYGHLRYWPVEWQPTFFDRGIRCDYERIEQDEEVRA
ncbi:MAG: molybdopterin-dependent oxidoreductase [Dehalococcoidia bacterium]